MRKLLIKILPLLLIVSLASASACMAQQDGYFNRVAMVSDGRLTRFTNMPITVYVGGVGPYSIKYLDDMQYALKEWQEQSSGLVRFEVVREYNGADILVSWVTKLEASDYERPLGMSELHRGDHDKIYVEMQICLQDTVTARPLSENQMKIVLLHELGHAIGIWGHSKNKDDSMYYASNVLHPTVNDIITLKSVYFHENNYPLHTQSISAIKEDLESDPTNAGLYYLLGTVYLDKGGYATAIESLKKCLALNPQYYRAHIALASAYKAIGQEQSAISEYLSLAQSSPSAMIYNVIGASYYEHDDVNRAIENFKNALQLDRIYEPAKRNLYRIYLNKGNEFINNKKYNEAIELLLDGLKTFPDSPEILNALGTAYSETGRFDEALEKFSLAIRINPGYTSIKNNMASCYNNMGVNYAKSNRWDEAIKAYKKAVELAPDIDSTKRNLSALYWNQALQFVSDGKDSEAVSTYLEFLKREPNSRDGYNNLGAVYSRLGNHEEAVKSLERAFQADQNSKDIRDNLSIAHQRWGIQLLESRAYKDALREFNKALEHNSDSSDIHVFLAIIYERLGESDKAVQYVNTALKLDPTNDNAKKIIVNLRVQQADTYIQSKEYDMALECLNSLPENLITPFLRDNIAYVYIMKGMYIEAVNVIDMVLKAEPNDKTAKRNLLSMESKLKNSLLRHPNSQEFKDQLARVRLSIANSYSQEADLVKAKQTLKSAFNLQPKDRDIRLILSEGCKALAEKFTKSGEKKQSDELLKWAEQLSLE
jgi:tetratricopeptide (TPR) repeat protein